MPNKTNFKTHEDYLEYYRKYREKNRKKHREYRKEYNKEWRKENGYYNEYSWANKTHLKEKLRRNIKSGLVKRGKCEECGKKKAQAHHDDYSKPLEVRWLCALHHKQFHLKKLSPCKVNNSVL